MLSVSISIDIRPDSALLRNQMLVESSFLKEKQGEKENLATNRDLANTTTKTPVSPPADVPPTPAASAKPQKQASPIPGPNATRIIEERKTRIAEDRGVRLEMTDHDKKASTIDLKDGEYIFGRGREAHVILPESDDLISRAHFALVVRNGRVSLKDMDSTNGTKVNGIDVDETELKKGDTISAGKAVLRVA
jgi:predicted component of type VI protein secretion system